jgi:hypothetical protein
METKAEKRARKERERQSRELPVTSADQYHAPVDVACVIHSKGYDWRYVENLYNMCRRQLSAEVRFHVYTEHDRSVPPHMIKHCLQEWDGIAGPKRSWWYKVQLFNPEHHTGDLLYLDLDTVVLRNIDWIAQSHSDYFWTIRDFRYLQKPFHNGMNSSVMKFNVARFSYVWDEFASRDPRETVRSYQGDQDFLQVTVKSEQRRFLDGNRFQSWRWQCADGGYDFSRRRAHDPGSGAKVGDTTDVLVFHGFPKPHQVHDPIVVNNWQ